ncbi:MAG: hypothetical protein WCJ19_02570 [bacterium]
MSRIQALKSDGGERVSLNAEKVLLEAGLVLPNGHLFVEFIESGTLETKLSERRKNGQKWVLNDPEALLIGYFYRKTRSASMTWAYNDYCRRKGIKEGSPQKFDTRMYIVDNAYIEFLSEKNTKHPSGLVLLPGIQGAIWAIICGNNLYSDSSNKREGDRLVSIINSSLGLEANNRAEDAQKIQLAREYWGTLKLSHPDLLNEILENLRNKASVKKALTELVGYTRDKAPFICDSQEGLLKS